MNFTKLLRSFAFLGFSWLILCGTLCAATLFQVSTTSLAFGELNIGQSNSQNFKVVNLQPTPLEISMVSTTAFFAINAIGQTPVACGGCPMGFTLAPNETKEVQVRFPGAQACEETNTVLTLRAGADEVKISLTGKLLCPELIFSGPVLSLKNNAIIAHISLTNVGTLPSVACVGQVSIDGRVVQAFDIPILPPNSKQFDFVVPASPGSHTIGIAIDSNNANREAREENNTRSNTITVPTPPPTPVTITVIKIGSGKGTVTDSAGMNCGLDLFFFGQFRRGLRSES
jgi:hypothetical protein